MMTGGPEPQLNRELASFLPKGTSDKSMFYAGALYNAIMT